MNFGDINTVFFKKGLECFLNQLLRMKHHYSGKVFVPDELFHGSEVKFSSLEPILCGRSHTSDIPELSIFLLNMLSISRNFSCMGRV